MKRLATIFVVCALPSGTAENKTADANEPEPLEVYTRIEIQSNKHLCLDHMTGKVTMTSCSTGLGAPEWSWPPKKGEKEGVLSTQGLTGLDECLLEDLTVKTCEPTSTKWTWNEETSQIQLGDECLGFGSTAVVGLHPCVDEGDDKAKQTWILETLESPEEHSVHHCQDMDCVQRRLPKFLAWSQTEITHMPTWELVAYGVAIFCCLCCCYRCCCRENESYGLPMPHPSQLRPWADKREPEFEDNAYTEDFLPDLWCCSQNGPICAGLNGPNYHGSAQNGHAPVPAYSSLAQSQEMTAPGSRYG